MKNELLSGVGNSCITTTIAMFNQLSTDKPISGGVVYFWESHTKNPDDPEDVKATEDLICKQFCSDCEKYEVRTGYLSRHNYMKKPWSEATEEDVEEAIRKGKEEQDEWLARCNPTLNGFEIKNWEDCIKKENNYYYEECKQLIKERLDTNDDFKLAFLKSVEAYAGKHDTIHENGQAYILEEIAWIMSLSLIHINKQVYLVHVGNDNPAIKAMFHQFPNLAKAVRWLSPRTKTVTFNNEADFLMFYRANLYAGCSYARHNPRLVNAINSYPIEEVSRENLQIMLNRDQAEKEILKFIISKMPGHVYWLNRDGKYMGCNDLQARDFGLDSKDGVVGKTNSDFFLADEADRLDKINSNVIKTGVEFKGEEGAPVHGGGYKDYLTSKTPLMDSNGKVIGLLGISIDITDKKRADALEAENKLHELRARDNESFRTFIAQMAHDIASPMIGLENLVKSIAGLPEDKKVMLSDILFSIRSIADALLDRYKSIDKINKDEDTHLMSVDLVTSDIVTRKMYEYVRQNNVQINYISNSDAKFDFIDVDRCDFERMVSNLVNNAVESLEGNEGAVSVSLCSDDDEVTLKIKDNGRGMSETVARNIEKGVSIATTKKNGCGLGLEQVYGVIKNYNGKIAVDSIEGSGTTFSITFKKSATPSWFVDCLNFKPNSKVFVLDDDAEMFGVWKNLFANHDLNVKYFSDYRELETCVEQLPDEEKNNVTVLSDYDLKSDKTGLSVVMDLDLHNRSIMVTSLNDARYLMEVISKVGGKVIPKSFISNLKVNIVQDY